MCLFMSEIVKLAEGGEDLNFEERSTLSVAYKNAVGARRAAWRTLQGETENSTVVPILREAVERELEELCRDIVKLLENILIKHPQATIDSQIFYLKMAGDYYRYLAEFVQSDELTAIQRHSADYYGRAMDLAVKTLTPTDPIRLGLALNYSVCLYEIMHDREAACQLATEAFDAAVCLLDDLDEESYKDGALILQLLRDNLNLWQ
jgi:14-3-3 protein epsilon